MNKIALSIMAVLVCLAAPALALDLHAARSNGSVGEQANGYIAALKHTPDVDGLVAEVNAKRRAEYARISSQNGQSIEVVAKLAAQQIVSGLDAGSSYQGADGSWRKK